MPARVASMTDFGASACPGPTQAPMAPFVTPLQLHTCADVGHLFEGHHCLSGRSYVEEEREPIIGQRRVAVERLHEIGDLAQVAHHDRAGEAPLANDELLVASLLGLRELHHFIVVVP